MQPVQSRNQGFTGTVNLQLSDLIQMVCLGRSDLIIRVKSTKGNGTIYIREGQIHHAQTDILQGEPAFFEILQWNDGQFEMMPFEDVGVNSVNKLWEHLLLEASRQRDEDMSKSECRTNREKTNTEFLEECESNGLDAEIDEVFDQLEVMAQQLMEATHEDLAEEPAGLQTFKVLVVDDSSFFSRQLKKMLEADSDMEVVAVARNGKEALQYLESHAPVDLITLDVQMPVMQGDTTLKHIMIRHPIPALIISTVPSRSLSKTFEFLQIGAIDFFAKPETHEDLTRYGERLRDLARRAVRAKVSHFRRWRKPRPDSRPNEEIAESANENVYVILGAEGAHMDWFRLPLSKLCRQGLVIGLQKLSGPFLAKFCQLLEEGVCIRAIPLELSRRLEPGNFYLGNAGQRVLLEADLPKLSLRMEIFSSESLSWQDGIHLWLDQLAGSIRERLNVHLLSGAHSLPPDLIEKLLEHKVRLILSQRETVMCTDFVDSVQAYSQQFPNLITWGTLRA